MSQHAFKPAVRGAGTIRRVVRRGSEFICGMCRDAYDDFPSALACVQNCWTQVLTLNPVIVRKQGRDKIVYRCFFCARDHKSKDLAAQCAKDCLAILQGKFADEMDGWGLSDRPQVPHKPRPHRPRLLLVAAPPSQLTKAKLRRPSAEAVPATTSKGPEQEKAAEPPAPTPDHDHEKDKPQQSAPVTSANTEIKPPVEAAETKAPAPAKKMKRPSEPFTRHGAEYVCTGCSKKYYTRAEVNTCFESHEYED